MKAHSYLGYFYRTLPAVLFNEKNIEIWINFSGAGFISTKTDEVLNKTTESEPDLLSELQLIKKKESYSMYTLYIYHYDNLAKVS